MYLRQLSEEKEKNLLDGFYIKFVQTENLTVGHVRIEKGKVLPEHDHPHEQVTTLISGQLEMTVGGETYTLNAGDAVVIPSNVKHSGVALTDCLAIDVFNPPRIDFNDLK